MSDIDNTEFEVSRQSETSGKGAPFADHTDSDSEKEIDSLYTDSVSVTSKGNLKWLRDFKDLCQFVNDLGLQPGKWTTPGGNSKLFQNSQITIRWYWNSGSLNLKGDMASQIKAKILNIANPEMDSDSNVIESSKYENLHIDLDQTNNDLHTESRSYSLNKDTSPICSDTEHINNISQIRDINTKLDSFVSHINAKLETLADEITTIKENKPYSILVLEDVVSELKKEKADLIRMNEDMREKYTNLLQTASDLRTRAMNLENEKSSLMTALKLIQQDNMLSNKRNAELQNQNDNLIAATKLLQNDMEGKTKERKRNFMEANRKSPTTTSKSLFDDSVLIVETKNRFDVLDDSDSKDDDGETPRTKRSEINSTNNQQQSFPVHQQSCNDQKQSRSTHQQIHNPNKSRFNQQRSNIREQKPNVAIVGDSMLKYINPSKLRKSTKCNIQVKTFPGAKVSDMKHYIKPTLSRTPDCLIMHIGTNDLKNSSPSEISSSISSLGQEIRKEVPNTNLVISEVIIRNDDPSLNVKISELNKNLAQVCANNNWDFITHKNILPVHLNSYGLHLNKQGSSYLAKNFINFLKSD